MDFKNAHTVGPYKIVEAEFQDAGTRHRKTFVPGDDVSLECEEVKILVQANHTPEIVADYLAK